MTRQLAFHLPLQEALTRADFFVSPSNDLALRTLDGWAEWPGRKLVLVGPEGAGKSHLTQIWASETGAAILRAPDLGQIDLAAFADRRVAVEDVHAIGPDEEKVLFHLHNMVTEKGALLLTAATPPRDWGLTLADLASRMLAAPVARLNAPDDALLSAVLIKLFADRQIVVPANLISYLVSRMPRSIGTARWLVTALDAHALALGRPVTRSLASAVLDRLDTE